MKELKKAEEIEEDFQNLFQAVAEIYKPDMVLVGIPTRGVCLRDRFAAKLKADRISGFRLGTLDITFGRDDTYSHRVLPKETNIPFIENKEVLLFDDIFFTGRTIRAALDLLWRWGRPSRVYLAVLYIREGGREVPIHPDFHAAAIKTNASSIKLFLSECDDKTGLYEIAAPARNGELFDG